MTHNATMEGLRFGAFIPPIHMNHENPTLCIERDMEVIEHLDRLGFHEAWIGEHHSGGTEVIASPELIIAAMAPRTRSIMLGTGVNSLPYHHPLILADRWMQLHHMTRGRAMFGCGPGSLPSDAKMMGVPVSLQRDRMEEALACIARLLRGETVTYRCEWFQLEEARLQLRPYDNQPIELSTACTVSPSGPMAAGRNGTSMMMLSATAPAALASAARNWDVACELAEAHGHTMDRRKWRMVGLMHIAETRDQARKDVEYGLADWARYYATIAPVPIVPQERLADAADYLVETGLAVIGTPEDAIGQIERLWDASAGGFGAYLIADLNWAPFAAKLKSYELMARTVIPRLKRQNLLRDASTDWINSQHAGFKSAQRAAVEAQFAKLERERAERLIANQRKADA